MFLWLNSVLSIFISRIYIHLIYFNSIIILGLQHIWHYCNYWPFIDTKHKDKLTDSIFVSLCFDLFNLFFLFSFKSKIDNEQISYLFRGNTGIFGVIHLLFTIIGGGFPEHRDLTRHHSIGLYEGNSQKT